MTYCLIRMERLSKSVGITKMEMRRETGTITILVIWNFLMIMCGNVENGEKNIFRLLPITKFDIIH